MILVVKNARIDQPACSRLKLVGLRQLQELVIAFVPVGNAIVDLLTGCSGFEPHEGIRKIVPHIVVLGREIVGFRLSLLTDQGRLLGILMHVMGNRSHVIEEFRIDRPLAILTPDRPADNIRAAFLD